MLTKAELRHSMRDRLPLPPDLRGEQSARICATIAALPQWQVARRVALFAPQPREPDIEQLWAQVAGKMVAYPRVENETLVLHSVGSLHELQSGKWGLREPAADSASLIVPQSVDVILVPGIAFTRTGARCGRGGGYYDRLLSELAPSAFKIGVCFPLQLVGELPTEPHDYWVDRVIWE